MKKLSDEFLSKLKEEIKPWKGIPVAISGGIDSGILAALSKPEFVVSVRLPGGERYDEIKYAKQVSKSLKLKHIIVEADQKNFNRDMKLAVKAIGRPIPHFNIYPLWCMYKKLKEMGIKEIMLGDGPDETLCGYTRNLIMNYLYHAYDIEAFKYYAPTINKIIPNSLEEIVSMYAELTDKDYDEVHACMRGESLIKGMNKVDMNLMRKDMDDMSNKIAKYFDIDNIRPYQDNPDFDRWQYELPDEAKIHDIEYGKYVLRLIAEQYLPYDIAWRKHKVGGPVYPVGKMWGQDNEFDKHAYIEYQEKILNGK